MNRKQLGILVILVVVLGAAGMLLRKKQGSSFDGRDTLAGTKLMADLPINDLTHLAIKHGTNELNLVKKDDLWRVRERNDYPANFSQISDFLVKARDLKVVQSEKVGPSQLARLELAQGAPTNAPTVVEFRGANDKPVATVLLGKMHMQKTKQPSPYGGGDEGWPDGRYVKVGSSDTVAIISNPLENIEPKADTWLNKDFFRVEKPKSIEVVFPVATNSWRLERETETNEWKLADAKPGEQTDSGKIAGVSNPFTSPTFMDVAPGANIAGTGTNSPIHVKIQTFDGFDYAVTIGEKTNDDYHLTMTVNAQIPKERVAGKDEKPEDKARLDKDFKDRQQKVEDKLKQEQGYQNWTYLVQSWEVEPLLKHRSELLAGKKEEPKTGDSATTNSTDKLELKPSEGSAPATEVN